MSIVALKRKANAKYSTHSNGSLGFSLNGTVRTRPSRIGQTSLVSRSYGAKSRAPDYVVRNGRNEGGQNGYCCTVDTNAVSKSVKNTRGMIANRYRWKNGGVGSDGSFSKNFVYNQWVQPDDNHGLDGKGEQGDYIKKVKMLAMNQNKAMSSNGLNEQGDPHVMNCGGTRNTVCSRRNGGSRIGGKHIPNAIYTKNTGSGAEITGGGGKTGGVISAGEHIDSVKYNKSNLIPIRSDKVFPYKVNSNRQCAIDYPQYDDAQTSDYYTTGLTSSDRPGCN